MNYSENAINHIILHCKLIYDHLIRVHMFYLWYHSSLYFFFYYNSSQILNISNKYHVLIYAKIWNISLWNINNKSRSMQNESLNPVHFPKQKRGDKFHLFLFDSLAQYVTSYVPRRIVYAWRISHSIL